MRFLKNKALNADLSGNHGIFNFQDCAIVHIDGVTGSRKVTDHHNAGQRVLFTHNAEFTEEARKQSDWRNHTDEEVSHRLFRAYL